MRLFAQRNLIPASYHLEDRSTHRESTLIVGSEASIRSACGTDVTLCAPAALLTLELRYRMSHSFEFIFHQEKKMKSSTPLPKLFYFVCLFTYESQLLQTSLIMSAWQEKMKCLVFLNYMAVP